MCKLSVNVLEKETNNYQAIMLDIYRFLYLEYKKKENRVLLSNTVWLWKI